MDNGAGRSPLSETPTAPDVGAAPGTVEHGVDKGRGAWFLAVRLGLVLLVIAVVTVVAGRVLDVSVDDVEHTVRAAGVLAPVIYAVVLFLGLSVPFNPMSDLATVNVAALLFQPEVSIPATFAAHSTALAVNYGVGRRFGPTLLRRVASHRGAARIESLGHNFSYRTLFLLRMALPLTAIGIDFVSYFSGMRRLSFWRFYVVSIVPWTLLSIVYFTSTSILKERSFVLVFVPAAVLIVAPTLFLVVRRRLTR